MNATPLIMLVIAALIPAAAWFFLRSRERHMDHSTVLSIKLFSAVAGVILAAGAVSMLTTAEPIYVDDSYQRR